MTALSIPGTHNSAACDMAFPTVRCQSANVTKQLKNGVRFLDIGVCANKGESTLSIVHNNAKVNILRTVLFSDICEEIYSFLKQNIHETVIMCIKNRGHGKAEDDQISLNLRDKIRERQEVWWTEPRIPALRDVRGKIVLMRRYALHSWVQKSHGGTGYGLDAQEWPNNCKYGIISKTNSGNIHLQDLYTVRATRGVNEKTELIYRHLERAAEQSFDLETPGATYPPLFLNFLSGGDFVYRDSWSEDIAAKINPEIVKYLCTKHGENEGPEGLSVGSAGTAIVLADWVGKDKDWDLVRCIIGMNARLGLGSDIWREG